MAKLNDFDPEAYLCFALARIADYPVNRVAELLPWAVADQIVRAKQTNVIPVTG